MGLHDHNLNGILADEMVRPAATSSLADLPSLQHGHLIVIIMQQQHWDDSVYEGGNALCA